MYSTDGGDLLYNSKSQIIDAVFHGIDWLKKNNNHYDAVLVLQPSNPHRNSNDINKMIRQFKNKKKKINNYCI